jgi:RNA polymerase sigma factor (TIGR02999 family)
VQAERDGKSRHDCDNFLVNPKGRGNSLHDPAEVTILLKAWNDGDDAALERLTERVYKELHLMARRYMKNERPGNTLQATALVHEVYLRLVDVSQVEWRERAQFFAMAAQMMRRILVDAARAKASRKRGSRAVRVNFDETAILAAEPDRSVIALDEALAAFSEIAARQAKVVELRYFGGLKEEEIAEVLKISPRTVQRDWEFARVWLGREMAQRSGRQA